jgi:WD40 repeat protein
VVPLSPTGGEVITVWNPRDMAREPFRNYRFEHVTALALDEGGRYLAAGNWNGQVRVWDVTREGSPPVNVTVGQNEAILDLAFSADGRRLAAGTGCRPDETKSGVQVWRLTWDNGRGHAEPVRRYPHKDFVFAVRFDGTGRWLATGCNDSVVGLYDVDNEKDTPERCAVPPDKFGTIYDLAFSPASERLAAACADGRARVYQVNQLDHPPLQLDHGWPGVRCVGFRGCGKCVVTGGYDRTAKVWDLKEGNPQRPSHTLLGPTDTICETHYLTQTEEVAVLSFETSLRFYQLDPQALLREVAKQVKDGSKRELAKARPPLNP